MEQHPCPHEATHAKSNAAECRMNNNINSKFATPYFLDRHESAETCHAFPFGIMTRSPTCGTRQNAGSYQASIPVGPCKPRKPHGARDDRKRKAWAAGTEMMNGPVFQVRFSGLQPMVETGPWIFWIFRPRGCRRAGQALVYISLPRCLASALNQARVAGAARGGTVCGEHRTM